MEFSWLSNIDGSASQARLHYILPHAWALRWLYWQIIENPGKARQASKPPPPALSRTAQSAPTTNHPVWRATVTALNPITSNSRAQTRISPSAHKNSKKNPALGGVQRKEQQLSGIT